MKRIFSLIAITFAMVITSTVSAQIQVFPPQEVKEVTFEVALNQVISMYPNRDSVDFYKLDSNITWDTAHVNLPNKVSLPPMFNLGWKILVDEEPNKG